MDLDLINPYVLRILISARKEDSIRAISGRIGLSYGWTYKWVQELASLGVFKLTRMKAYLQEDNSFYRGTLRYMRETLSREVMFYYEALALFGVTYCFTKTDAVFVWTKGGYNIGRYREYYPVFIKVNEEYRDLFEAYCKRLCLNIGKGKGVFYEVTYLYEFRIEYCDSIPVDGLEETIGFMKKYKYNFQPALEMIKEDYKKRIAVKYREVITN